MRHERGDRMDGVEARTRENEEEWKKKKQEMTRHKGKKWIRVR
jgi:hypothetical protein